MEQGADRGGAAPGGLGHGGESDVRSVPPVTDDLRKQRDSLLLVVEQLKQRIYHLRDLLEQIYRDAADAEQLIRAELENWEEP